MKPLIKWAGGKRQILPKIVDLLPEQWNRYFEPFAGGLALLVELHNTGKLGSAVISETNPELYNLYMTVKENPLGLSETIERLDFRNDEHFYYSTRVMFNRLIGSEDHTLERAALFLYFNRHGYNGLWRVNRKGKFNVPFGRYSSPKIPVSHDIQEFSKLLKNVRILREDFQSAIEDVEVDDMVYFDPPYFPVSRTSNFTDYTESGFGLSDQIRLLKTCQALEREGKRFLLSNSCSDKIVELFGEFNIMKIRARRSINSNSLRRSGHFELIISNLNLENKAQEPAMTNTAVEKTRNSTA